jgi:hypothetical protein
MGSMLVKRLHPKYLKLELPRRPLARLMTSLILSRRQILIWLTYHHLSRARLQK